MQVPLIAHRDRKTTCCARALSREQSFTPQFRLETLTVGAKLLLQRSFRKISFVISSSITSRSAPRVRLSICPVKYKLPH